MERHETCDPWAQREFTAQLEAVNVREKCSHCLPDCEYTEYSVATSAAKFR